jgi:hypothetical protein
MYGTQKFSAFMAHIGELLPNFDTDDRRHLRFRRGSTMPILKSGCKPEQLDFRTSKTYILRMVSIY